MPIPYLLAPDNYQFPDPNLAMKEPNGLLAIGGDLKPERLIHAYHNGIFPWYNEDQPILWWSPNPRAVLFLENLKISHSLKKTLKKEIFHITFDKDFAAVIKGCAAPRKDSQGTWIHDEMIDAFLALHRQGFAHSVEAWYDNKLVGGLYGVMIGKIFCAESMFSFKANASKVILVWLVNFLKPQDFCLIDCQILNPHLTSLGATEIPRSRFLELLRTSSD